MPADIGHLGVLIGSCPGVEQVRRSLSQAGVPHLGATSHLRGVRRRLWFAHGSPTVLCIALDRTTLRRYGDALAAMLAGLASLPGTVRSIGLLPEHGLTPGTAQLGCDIYVRSAEEALAAMCAWRRATLTAPTDRRPASDARTLRINPCGDQALGGYGGRLKPSPRFTRRTGDKDDLSRFQRFYRSSRIERPAADFWDFDVSL